MVLYSISEKSHVAAHSLEPVHLNHIFSNSLSYNLVCCRLLSPSELALSKLEEILTESHQLSPKAKVGKNATVRRKKRPLPHMRSQHLDEALSPVTTPTDEEVFQRIKQVAGSTQTRHQSPENHYLPGGFAFYSVSKLLLIISFVYATTHSHTHTLTAHMTNTHTHTHAHLT